MTILCCDTETSGLPSYTDPSDAPHQPHLVELAMAEYDDDGTELLADSWIVKPDGWIIPPEVAAIHRITTEHALEVGEPEALVVSRYVAARRRSSTVVAHNWAFDKRILRIAMLRAGMTRSEVELLEALPGVDTASRSSRFTKLAPTQRMLDAGIPWKKTPKLRECMQIFFGETIAEDSAHDALVDVRNCARVFFHLKSLGAV